MPITPPTIDELFRNWKARMEGLGFTHWAEGSRIGAIGKTISAYLVDLWNALWQVESQTNPSTARGVYLDRIGQQFGVTRLGPQAASTVGRGPAVKFTNNGGTAITIAAATRVWNSADPDVGFFTAGSLVLGGGAEGYVDVIAQSAGDLYNVGTNQLDSHNAGMGQVSVTNVRPIGGGTLGETDDSYRFRITSALQARHGETPLAIQQALLRVPGVRDALVQSGVRGNGTVDVTVIPVDRYASTDLLAACEQAMTESVAGGVSWRLRPPVTRRVNVTVQLRLQGGATLADVRALVDTGVRAYLDNLRVNDGRGGSDLIYNELVSRVQDASRDILDSAVSLSLDGAPVLQGNITTRAGERLVSGAVSIV